MKQPLVPVALVYAGGLLLGEFFQPSFGWLCAAALALAAATVFWTRVRHWLFWPLILLTGWTNMVGRTAIFSPHDLRLRLADSTEFLTVRGTLSETPSQRVFLQDEKQVPRWLARVETSAVLQRGTNWQAASGSLLVLTPGILPKELFAGAVVEITGVSQYPPGPRAEGLFDYRTYLRRQGIYYQLKTESANDWRLISSPPNRPVCDRFLEWAQGMLGRGLPVEDEPLRLLWAMTLGWKAGLTNEIYEPFMQSGTMHIFAISGLHIALITGILVALLRVLRVSRGWCGWVVVPLIWFYTAASGWQSSAIRSTIMMTVIIGGWAMRRPTELLNSLAAAAIIILLWDPQQLFGASFQLSFFVVVSLALFLPSIQKARDRLLQTDPLLPSSLLPRWRRGFQSALHLASTPLAVSVAAWLGSLPLCAWYFHLFSPVTLLANLLIVPMSSLALTCNVGSLLCGSWLPSVAELFNHSAWFWMRCMMGFSNWCIELPMAFVYVRGLSLGGVVVYYLLLLGFLSGWLWAPKRRAWGMAALSVGLGFFLYEWYAAYRTVSLTILPVNGSLSVYLRAPGKPGDFLLDCGASNTVQFITKPFLRAQGVNRLGCLVLTHGDVRHIGGAELLTALFAVRQVCASPVRFRSGVYRRVLEHLCRTPGLVRTLASGQQLGTWAALYPSSNDQFPKADDNALVLESELDGTRVLLCSDLGRLGQNALLQRRPHLRAAIIVTGLPAGGQPLCDALLDTIQPHLIIVADAEFPASERADPKLRERLAKRNIPIVYTRSAGAVTIEFKAKGWELRAMSGQKIAWRRE